MFILNRKTQTLAALFAMALTAAAQAGLTTPTGEMDNYLVIGTGNDDNAKALDASNSDLGADVVVLSESTIDNVGLNLDDVFLSNAGSQWVNVNDTANNASDYLPGAALVGEGVSWTGDVALTSPNASFDSSNSEYYAQRGIDAQSPMPGSSVSNSLYFSDGVGDGVNTAGGQAMTANGVNTSVDLSALRSEINDWEAYVTGLAPEAVINSNIENVDYQEFNVDAWDTNMDGIAVVDVNVGDNDWSISNSNVVFESEKGTIAIIRILNGSNLDLSQSTLMLGDGVFGNDDAGSPSAGIDALGVVIVVANEYNNGQGGTNDGEEIDSSDQVFSFDNMVVNGVAFHDLLAFAGSDPQFDDGETELSMQNVQGCTHIISPKVSLSNVRIEHCAFPEMTPGPEIPAPAALPAGLALIGLLATRRRR